MTTVAVIFQSRLPVRTVGDTSQGIVLEGADTIGPYNDACRLAERADGDLVETKVVVAAGRYSILLVFDRVSNPRSILRLFRNAMEAKVALLPARRDFEAWAFGHQPSQFWRSRQFPAGSAVCILERPIGARLEGGRLQGTVATPDGPVEIASILDPALFADAANAVTRYAETELSELLRVGGHNILVGGSDEGRVRRVSLVFAKGDPARYALTRLRIAVWSKLYDGAWVSFDDLDLADGVS
jgi:hypothetical protein